LSFFPVHFLYGVLDVADAAVAHLASCEGREDDFERKGGGVGVSGTFDKV
jgi:hypothetical protein